MMMMIESTVAVRFSAVSNFCSSSVFPYCRSILSSDVYAGVHVNSRRISLSGSFDIPCHQRLNSCANVRRKNLARNRVKATAEHLGSASDPIKHNGATGYHPFEDISELAPGTSGVTRLTAAETSRTVVEVKQDEDILQALASETNILQVIVGLDTVEMMNELDLSGAADVDFGVEEIGEDDSDFEEDNDDDDDEDEDEDDDDDEDDGDDDYDEDWVSVLEDNNDLDESDESIGDWAKLETMRYSHPMNFAKKLAEVASDSTIDWMKRPPVGVVVQGFLRPILPEEHQLIQKQLSGENAVADKNHTEAVIEDKLEESGSNAHNRESGSSTEGSIGADELETDKGTRKGTSCYKLEMIAIHLLSIHGHPISVEVEDFRRARPDLIANFSTKIIDRLKAYGEKTVEALQSLCWRCQGIQVEEASIIGVDSLGFDVRVCSGTQLQTLRFTFATPATSECSAEIQLHDLLFPKKEETHSLR